MEFGISFSAARAVRRRGNTQRGGNAFGRLYPPLSVVRVDTFAVLRRDGSVYRAPFSVNNRRGIRRVFGDRERRRASERARVRERERERALLLARARRPPFATIRSRAYAEVNKESAESNESTLAGAYESR